MTDLNVNNNGLIFRNAVKKLGLKSANKELSEKLVHSKGDISSYLSGRKTVSDNFLKKFSEAYNIDLLEFDNKVISINQPTGYYYPDVMAAAGIDKEVLNNEINKIPINIPNWGKDLDFINVFGDSMYPKFNSGEIIGIKEVEFAYLIYGFARFLKWSISTTLKKGKFTLKNKTLRLRGFYLIFR